MSIQVLSAEKFRREMAGLIDPNAVLPTEDRQEIKESCVKLISISAYLYGDDLDRQRMWDRIANGILAAVAKAGGDWEKFVNDLLVYVHADPAKTARNKDFQAYMEGLLSKDAAWRTSWLRMFETRHMILLPLARREYTLRREQLKREWEEERAERADDGLDTTDTLDLGGAK